MNTVALNINWFSALTAWLQKPTPKAAGGKPAGEEKQRVRIAGLR